MPLKAVEAKHETVTHHLDSIITFGQYKGRSIDYVLDIDPNYIIWAYKSIYWFDIDNDVEEMADSLRFDRGLYYTGNDLDPYY